MPQCVGLATAELLAAGSQKLLGCFLVIFPISPKTVVWDVWRLENSVIDLGGEL